MRTRIGSSRRSRRRSPLRRSRPRPRLRRRLRPPVAAPGLGAGRSTFVVGALCALALVGGYVAWASEGRCAGSAPNAPRVSTAVVTAPGGSTARCQHPRASGAALDLGRVAAEREHRPSARQRDREAHRARVSRRPMLRRVRRSKKKRVSSRRPAAPCSVVTPPGGLALLDEHARTFPNGFLASDRAAEHIVVLCGLGRQDEAAREAKAFLAGRPEGPLTRRVTMSCAGTK